MGHADERERFDHTPVVLPASAQELVDDLLTRLDRAVPWWTLGAPSTPPVISDALGFWRGEPSPEPYRRHPARRNRDAGRFVDAVIEAAHRL